MPVLATALLLLAPSATGFQGAERSAFEARASSFEGSLAPTRARVFDVVATDIDLDGDPDVLINWHHEQPLELFENKEGHFRRLEPTLADGTGLDDAPGIASLFGEEPATRERARSCEALGLFAWHDPIRRPTRWAFLWRPDPSVSRLELELNRDLSDVHGLDGAHILVQQDGRLEVDLGHAGLLEFEVETPLVATRLELRLVGKDESSNAGVLRVGRDLQALGSHAAFWKPDPHGAAWLNLEGSPHPELFLCRGGLRGQLAPPLAPKRDRWFTHTGRLPLYRLADDGRVPPDHARARSVEAVDLEADGSLELSISARGGPGRLLARRGDGEELVDLTAQLGLGEQQAEVRAWLDIDDDGLDDLLLLEPPRITLHRNAGGGRLEAARDGAELGLVLPRPGRTTELFERAWLRPVDLDGDGQLDLLILAYGRLRRTLAFLRRGEGFVESTEALGLQRARSYETAVVLDADLDGAPDLLTLGPVQQLWRNGGGTGFEPEVVPVEEREGPVRAATCLDADGDGRLDVVAVADRPLLLRNTDPTGEALLVRPRAAGHEPVGALVIARYRSGRASAQRFGSEHSTAFSQALQPLRFGAPADDPVVAVEVRWPGTSDLLRTPVPAGATSLELRRP